MTLAVLRIILTHWCYSSFMKSRQHSSCPHLERKVACIINCKMLSRYSQGRHMHASNWWKCKVMTYPLLNVCLCMSYIFLFHMYIQSNDSCGWTMLDHYYIHGSSSVQIALVFFLQDSSLWENSAKTSTSFKDIMFVMHLLSKNARLQLWSKLMFYAQGIFGLKCRQINEW